ncbi:MAG: GNAT family N-acetyltransferase [Goleter apudmare HA4340-LM2]|jgi:hypothetical protein|nr:GNAT family N-acetyltransferase [Goleter apudmare HA4340-LM2]
MHISITSIYTVGNDEWDLIWSQCDYATYFHSREWAEIWNAYTQGKIRPEPILVLFSDGKKALLPFSVKKIFKGLVNNYISSITGTFGGWISNYQLEEEHVNLLLELFTSKFNNFYLRFNPYNEMFSKIELNSLIYDETYVLNLNKGFEKIYQGWARGNKSSTKKAIKEGVFVRVASTIDDWNDYYQVYEDSLRRWADKASSKYEWDLFKEIFQRNSNNYKLWLAIYKNQVISGILCFYAKKHAVYWHGATLEDFFHLRPVNILMYESIKSACEQGYSWFDFNPSGGHEGVKEFKKRFGAEALPCPVWNHESHIVKAMKKLRFK